MIRPVLLAALAPVAAAGALVPLAASGHGGSSPSSAAAATVVARYVTGPSVTRHDHQWQSDRGLHAGGDVQKVKASKRMHPRTLFTRVRVHPGAYSIPVVNAGKYLVSFRYSTCHHEVCHRHSAERSVAAVTTASGAHRVVVRPDSAARRHGVANLTVARLPTTISTPMPVAQPAGGIFGTNSVWSPDISDAPTDPNSAAMVANLLSQVNTYSAAFNVTQYNVQFYSVPADQATTTVLFSNCQHRAKTPANLYGGDEEFVDIPIPDNAAPAAGTDATLSIYRPATDQLWELWKAYHDDAGWHACWGGRLDHVSRSTGIFANGYGAAATGIAGEGGDVTIADAESGTINHALSLAIPAPANYPTYSWPAQRSDGSSTDPNAIPEGTRLRLDPSIDVSTLGLTPIGEMIARAAQTYGFIVNNKSGAVSITAESGNPTLQQTGTDPWVAILGGMKPYQVLTGFPWQDLQVLPQNYGEPTS